MIFFSGIFHLLQTAGGFPRTQKGQWKRSIGFYEATTLNIYGMDEKNAVSTRYGDSHSLRSQDFFSSSFSLLLGFRNEGIWMMRERKVVLKSFSRWCHGKMKSAKVGREKKCDENIDFIFQIGIDLLYALALSQPAEPISPRELVLPLN